MLDQLDVLIIEDSPTDAMFVELQLRRCLPVQSRVDICSYFADGLKALDEHVYDVILVDLSLPDSSQSETLAAIADLARRWPVVVFTSSEDQRVVEQLLDLGAQDFLPKGMLDEAMLVRTIHHSVQRHLLVKELLEAIQLIGRLEGLLPLCAYCKKIRDDSLRDRDVSARWIELSDFLVRRNKIAEPSDICPSCRAQGLTMADAVRK